MEKCKYTKTDDSVRWFVSIDGIFFIHVTKEPTLKHSQRIKAIVDGFHGKVIFAHKSELMRLESIETTKDLSFMMVDS